MLFGKKILNHLNFKAATALRFGLTSILALILIILTKDLFKISDLSTVHWQLLGVIIFTSGAGALFIYYYGLKKVTASTATICELFWPLSAVLLDYILNKNVLNSIQIGASLVLLLAFYKVVKEGKTKNIEFTAKVVAGLGYGAKLGRPTLNLDKVDLNIDYGVYLVEVLIDKKKYNGLMHFGTRDTFNKKASTELYIRENVNSKKHVKIKIIKKIRDIKKFGGANELKEQISKDIEKLKG